MSEVIRLDDLLAQHDTSVPQDPKKTPVSTEIPVTVMDQFEQTSVVDKKVYDTWYEKAVSNTVSATDGVVDVAAEAAVGFGTILPDMTTDIIAAGLRFAGDVIEHPEQLIPKDPIGALKTITDPLPLPTKMVIEGAKNFKALRQTFSESGKPEDDFKLRKEGRAAFAQELSALGFYVHSYAKNFKEKMSGDLDHEIAFNLGSVAGQIGFSFLAASVNPALAIGAITGDMSATKYLENRARNVPWVPSAVYSATVGAAQGQLENITLKILAKPFFSRFALMAENAINSAVQESAQSLAESAGDELIGAREVDPVEDIKQAALEGALGFFGGGIDGLTVVNYSYNRVKRNLNKMGVPKAQQEALATRLLRDGSNIMTDLIKKNSGVDDGYFKEFDAAMKSGKPPQEFFISVDQKHDDALKKRFANLKSTDPAKMEKLVLDQGAIDAAQEIMSPGSLEEPKPILPDITQAAETIITGRDKQLTAEIAVAEEQVTRLSEQVATLQKEKKAHQDVLDKLNTKLNDLDNLYVQQRDLTSYTVEELQKQKIQLQGSDVEKVRRLARNVGEQKARAEVTKAFKEKQSSIQQVKDAVVHFVKKHIPAAHRGEFLVAVRDAKTDNNLRKVVEKIYAKSDEYHTKVLQGKIAEKLAKLGPTTDKGKVQKGRFGNAAIQDVADHIRTIAKLSKDDVALRQSANTQKIQEIISGQGTGDPSLLFLENELLNDFGAISTRNPDELTQSLDALQKVSRNLKTLGQAVVAEEVAKKEMRYAKIALEVRPPELEAKLDRQRGTFKEKFRKLNQKFFGWGAGASLNAGTMFQLLDNTKSGKGEISQLAERLIDATRLESEYNQFLVDSFQTAFTESFKVKTASQIEERMRKDLSYNASDGAYIADVMLNNGKGKELKINKATIRYWYMLAHDINGKEDAAVWETLTGQNAYNDAFEKAESTQMAQDFSKVKGNAIPETELRRMFSTLSESDKKFASQQKSFYNQTYLLINPVYRRIFGVNLPKVQNYVPMARVVDQAAKETFSMLEDVSNQMGPSKSGALRLRNEQATAAFRELGDVQIMSNMVLEMSHFMGSYETIADVFSILRQPDIRQAINEVSDGEQLENGDWSDGNMYKRLVALTQVVGSRGKMHMEINKMAQRLSNNLSSGAVAGQIELGVAQMMSFAAVLEDTSVKDVKEGIVDFFNDPVAVAKVLGRSPIMRMRYQNIILEIQDLARSTKMGTLSRKQDWRSHLFLPLKLGDKGAVLLGGWVKFRSVYNKTNDLSAAYKAFDTFIETTQQSGSLTQLSTSQTGYWRVFFKFLSAPQQYFRREVLALNDVVKGRISPVEGIKKLLVYHFLLSGFFNLVKNLFQVKDDQLAQSVLVGPVVGIPVLGAMVEQLVMLGLNMYDFSTTGEPSEGRVNELSTPIFSMANDIITALHSAEKYFENDEFFSMLDAMMLAGENTAALTAGVPKQFGEVARGLLAYSQGELPLEALPMLIYGRTVNQAQTLFNSSDNADVSAMGR